MSSMLRWLSSKHRRSTSGGSLQRVSLELPSAAEQQRPGSISSPSPTNSGNVHLQSQQRSASAAAFTADQKAHMKANLRRRSLPALHLQEEDKSAAIMSNPPVFNNPLRRRGCCDHQHTQQLYQYRAEAIEREQAVNQACRVALEAS